jgi:hypothetical protein
MSSHELPENGGHEGRGGVAVSYQELPEIANNGGRGGLAASC